MRSSLPSPSESNVLSTHTWPCTQSRRVDVNTACDRPLTNVGTAPAGSGAATDFIRPTGLVPSFGGIGTADALLAPTTVAMALAVTAAANSLNLKICSPLEHACQQWTLNPPPEIADRQRSGVPPRDEMSPRMQVDAVQQERYWY